MLPKHKKFIIDPKIGVGPIRFGMSKKKIEKILDTSSNAEYIRIHYSDELICDEVEFYRGSLVYLGYFWLTGIKDINQIIAHLLVLDPKLHIGEGNILSEALCIYVQGRKDTRSGLEAVQSIHVFHPNKLDIYKTLSGKKTAHSRLKDYIGKINQEGVSLFDLSVFMVFSPILWLSLKSLLSISSEEKIFSRYFGWQDLEGFWFAIILIGLLLLLIHFILWLKRSSTILHKSPHEYILSKQRNQLYLSVVCGTVAEYDVQIPLTREQRREFWRRGIPFMKAIAENIRYYSNRQQASY